MDLLEEKVQVRQSTSAMERDFHAHVKDLRRLLILPEERAAKLKFQDTATSGIARISRIEDRGSWFRPEIDKEGAHQHSLNLAVEYRLR